MPLKDLTKIISIRTMLQKSKLYDISKTTKSFQYKWGALISLWLIFGRHRHDWTIGYMTSDYRLELMDSHCTIQR